MTEHSDGKQKRSIRAILGGWVYAALFRAGWARRFLAGVSVLALVAAFWVLAARTTFRQDPSFLAPPSVSMYIETKELTPFFKNVGAWRLWTSERREGKLNQLQLDLAGMISGKVAGLGTSLTLRWISGAGRAAYCVSGDGEGNPPSWALYLGMEEPGEIVSEIVSEPGMRMERLQEQRAHGIFRLSDTQGGALYFAVIDRWLIISSDDKLPMFALDSLRKPALSLAGTNILPRLTASRSVRGMFDPAQVRLATDASGALPMHSWMNPESRAVFSAALGQGGGVTVDFSAVSMRELSMEGGLLPFLKIVVIIFGIVGMGIIAVILLIMLNLGGWLKVRALRAGIAPARGPETVDASAAFKEDAGITRTTDANDMIE